MSAAERLELVLLVVVVFCGGWLVDVVGGWFG